MMRSVITLVSILLFTAGLAWAEEPTLAVETADLAPVTDVDSGSCNSTQALPEEEQALADWADAMGFGKVFTAAGDEEALAACPAVISCNATHCVETALCAVRDTGANSCCVGGLCLQCLPPQTIKVKRCRCAGGGCLTANSQSFFCA